MKRTSPPRLACILFEWYCGYAKVEDLQGDLDEWFLINTKSKGLYRAKLIYWKQVFSLIISYSVSKRKKESQRSAFSSHALSFSMMENYLKVGFRNIARHKYFSIVNIVGLSIGMSIGLLLIAMYANVCSYDNFHLKKNNIYRVVSERTEGIDRIEFASCPAVLGEKLKNEYAGLKSLVRLNSTFGGDVVLEKENLPLRGLYADANFFSIFTYPLIEGHAPTVLTKANTVVLTQSAANKIFSTSNVVGKVFEIKDVGSFEITGVMKDPPKNSHIEFEVLASYSSLPSSIRDDQGNPEQWKDFRNQYVYVLLPDGANVPSLDSFLNDVSQKMYPKESNVKAAFELQALIDITPGPDLQNSIGPQWDNMGFIIFGGISLLILLPACFNYTNISIARALKRSKEIGLRKTMGGQKNQIFFQFITETVIITMISLCGALLLFFLLRKEFQSLLVEASNLDLSLTPQIIALFVAFALFTGLASGAVPALYFSGLNPIQALKNQSAKTFSGMKVRKVLTVFQFFLSLCFIIFLVGFSRQYRYSLNYDFGFQKENILDVDLRDVNKETFRSEFSRLASVQSISMSSGVLGLSPSSTWIHSTEAKDSIEISQLFVDDHFIHDFKLSLIAGKNFPSAPWKNEQFIIVNEQFLKEKNITSPIDAVGQMVRVEGKDLEVIGVLKDFHFASLQLPIESFFFRMDPNQFTHANLVVSSDDAYSSISEMEQTWKKIDTGRLSAHFLNDEIDEAYSFYTGLLKMFGMLGLLALSISLLGLLGMVVYTSENKTKEVGIRKVMGATTLSISVLLSKDYLKLIVYAALLSIPVTIFLFDRLVSNIQYYHVTLSPWDILLSFFALVVLGLSTIASQTIKIASTNPAETLKYE